MHAARAKMRAAQQARWAKIKGTAPSAKPVKKAKRKMSAQGLANIRAGVAKRMAAQGKAFRSPRGNSVLPEELPFLLRPKQMGQGEGGGEEQVVISGNMVGREVVLACR